MKDTFLTATELGAQFGRTYGWVYDLSKRGKVRSKTSKDGLRLFSRNDTEKYVRGVKKRGRWKDVPVNKKSKQKRVVSVVAPTTRWCEYTFLVKMQVVTFLYIFLCTILLLFPLFFTVS